jgi:hypothetical protein
MLHSRRRRRQDRDVVTRVDGITNVHNGRSKHKRPTTKRQMRGHTNSGTRLDIILRRTTNVQNQPVRNLRYGGRADLMSNAAITDSAVKLGGIGLREVRKEINQTGSTMIKR